MNVTCSGRRRCRVISNETQCVCLIECPSGGLTVCGTDGQTYASQCALELAACRENNELHMLYQGACLLAYENVTGNLYKIRNECDYKTE